MKCKYCGKEQTLISYCVQNKKGECITYETALVFDGKKTHLIRKEGVK